jgi:hypothetical protein
MFKITNLDQVFKEMDAWLLQAEAEVERVAISYAHTALKHAANRSPQYSGDFVSNWKLSVNRIPGITEFEPNVFPDKMFPTENPYQMGERPGIDEAIQRNEDAISEFNFKLGDTIWLSNSAYHDSTYAWKIENSTIKLRPVNYGGYAPLKQVRNFMRHHFREINKQTRKLLK